MSLMAASVVMGFECYGLYRLMRTCIGNWQKLYIRQMCGFIEISGEEKVTLSGRAGFTGDDAGGDVTHGQDGFLDSGFGGGSADEDLDGALVGAGAEGLDAVVLSFHGLVLTFERLVLIRLRSIVSCRILQAQAVHISAAATSTSCR